MTRRKELCTLYFDLIIQVYLSDFTWDEKIEVILVQSRTECGDVIQMNLD